MATELAIELDHPACDCLYLALALEKRWTFVTADDRLLRKIAQQEAERFRARIQSLSDAARERVPEQRP